MNIREKEQRKQNEFVTWKGKKKRVCLIIWCLLCTFSPYLQKKEYSPAAIIHYLFFSCFNYLWKSLASASAATSSDRKVCRFRCGRWSLVQWKAGRKQARKKYCFDYWWCNIDHLQFFCLNLLLCVFQIKPYTDDDWFLICLFPLLSKLFCLSLHTTAYNLLCLRLELEPK